jgi:hypothetical protein
MPGRAASNNVASRHVHWPIDVGAQPLLEGATRRRQRLVAVAEGVAAREGGRPYGHPLTALCHRGRRPRVTAGTTLGEGRKPTSSRDSTARTFGSRAGVPLVTVLERRQAVHRGSRWVSKPVSGGNRGKRVGEVAQRDFASSSRLRRPHTLSNVGFYLGRNSDTIPERHILPLPSLLLDRPV